MDILVMDGTLRTPWGRRWRRAQAPCSLCSRANILGERIHG
ncbi:hypothetical protein D187_000017 [Cystobacter fuscus DSM 2262]|uniref:Uncharacterized protein n=1 Tax=Cystobacter fuscus (strain ATCC 25194 / DSM 2262 / NBRC 100088 / M29) TaxID=1242864 RepID=S9PK28_CYSF2|nr:hypothetical protein D187_000017 [Cystobacter fuscus DSM 2262]